jgi:hypothetical protein
MPGFPLTIGTVLSCFHQAPAKIAPTPRPVTILGQPVATQLEQIGVVSVLCPFAPGGAPSPCVTIKWSLLATKVTVQAQPLVLMPPPGTGPAPGVCIGAAPQGAAVMRANQAKVFVT